MISNNDGKKAGLQKSIVDSAFKLVILVKLYIYIVNRTHSHTIYIYIYIVNRTHSHTKSGLSENYQYGNAIIPAVDAGLVAFCRNLTPMKLFVFTIMTATCRWQSVRSRASTGMDKLWKLLVRRLLSNRVAKESEGTDLNRKCPIV